jgi:hypothetical protein
MRPGSPLKGAHVVTQPKQRQALVAKASVGGVVTDDGAHVREAKDIQTIAVRQ